MSLCAVGKVHGAGWTHFNMVYCHCFVTRGSALSAHVFQDLSNGIMEAQLLLCEQSIIRRRPLLCSDPDWIPGILGQDTSDVSGSDWGVFSQVEMPSVALCATFSV